jgi:hypothetical protein
MFRQFLAFTIGVSSIVSVAATQENEMGWKNLNRLPHRASFIFADNDRDCEVGTLKSITDTSLTVKRKDGTTRTIERTDLLRVSLGAWARGTLFSSRSSWEDVSGLESPRLPKWTTNLIVETRAGQRHQGNLVSVSDDKLTLKSDGNKFDIPKSEIAKVTYLTPKPVSDSASYVDDEFMFLKVFDPELWPTLFGVQGSLSVTLFDVSKPEDNTQILCKNSLWGSKGPVLNLTQH